MSILFDASSGHYVNPISDSLLSHRPVAFASLSLFHGPGRSEPLAATRIAAVLVPYKMVRPNGVGKGMGGPVSFGAEIHPACTANSPGARKSSRNRRPCAVEADSSSIYANGTNNVKAIQTGCLLTHRHLNRIAPRAFLECGGSAAAFETYPTSQCSRRCVAGRRRGSRTIDDRCAAANSA